MWGTDGQLSLFDFLFFTVVLKFFCFQTPESLSLMFRDRAGLWLGDVGGFYLSKKKCIS